MTRKYSVDNSYDASYTFFRGRARRPKIEISISHSGSRVGFKVRVQRNGIRRPSADCNGTQYNFERQDHDGELDFLQVNIPYFVYPFGINQDPNKGAYILQWGSRHREMNQFDTIPIQASIRISGEGFEMEKVYNLKSNLSDLREKRLNPNEELIRPENITFSLEEIKEPSSWRRFLSSFSLTRSRIPK
jgi:hypothetical protein